MSTIFFIIFDVQVLTLPLNLYLCILFSVPCCNWHCFLWFFRLFFAGIQTYSWILCVDPVSCSLCCTCLLALIVSLMDILGFYLYKIMSTINRDNFTHFFSNWMPFISFSCLIAYLELPVPSWIAVMRLEILALFLISGGKYLVFHCKVWC